ncbi:MAG TPA: rubrerythrin family protein [Candidatus Dormibacteraeota bacterium]|nr:rubrerythrin family protein [Candidatus Dormibacteraeota bacterium]
MQESITPDLAKLAAVSAQDEYADRSVYLALSRREKNPEFKKALENIANGEQSHYEFWKIYAPDAKVSSKRLRSYVILLIRMVLGLTFTLKFMERHEGKLHEHYRKIAESIPPGDKARFQEMMASEEGQEDLLIGKIQENRVKYMSFIVLGLADAVVEISGIHAGSLGIYGKTELAGLAGIIAGMAASIAMGTAAYAQAKQGFTGSAKWSAIYTGVSYMITAVLLAMPYFLAANITPPNLAQEIALATSLVIGVVLVATMTFYDTVISARAFKRQFGEIAGIILAASLALFIIGTVVGQYLGIRIG